ncbi:hypothetical protein [Marinobacter sp. LQ44]|uniref:hypothetical protein n=1 Tax=Marinobacter sp. LQ44 TaxID=1749259 RepID=UPI0012E6FA0B|nr:hypothetical protein [Marinobacter sp. LQ44]
MRIKATHPATPAHHWANLAYIIKRPFHRDAVGACSTVSLLEPIRLRILNQSGHHSAPQLALGLVIQRPRKGAI